MANEILSEPNSGANDQFALTIAASHSFDVSVDELFVIYVSGELLSGR